MQFKWPKMQKLVFNPTFSDEVLEYVLIEHEVDMLFVSKDKGTYYINYLIDEDIELHVLRYLCFEVSKMEVRALVTRGVSLYECMEDKAMFIYDVDSSDERAWYPITFKKIPIEALPEKNALLPPMDDKIVKDIYGFSLGEVCIIIDTNGEDNNLLPFSKLSKLLDCSQAVADAATTYYCEEYGAERSSISSVIQAEALQAASFAVLAKVSNEEVKKSISEILPRITLGLINKTQQQVYEILDHMPEVLARSFFEYYKFVLKNKVESIFYVDSKSFYLNEHRASKIKKNVNSANYVRESTENIKGYLVGANVKTGSFYFENQARTERIRGKVAEEFLDTHASITIDESTLWSAKITKHTEFRFSNFKQSFTLHGLERVAE